MKKLTKKFVAIVMALFVVSAISASMLAAQAATDDNIGFSFTIYSENYTTTRETNGRYRGTEDNDNAWKVNLRTSDEATNCGTKFCIALNDGTLCSAWKLVEKGSGSHYYAADNDGDKATVYLQGQDNNNSTKVYDITGYWDEETGVTPD